MQEHSWSRITPAIIALQTHATFLGIFEKFRFQTVKSWEDEKSGFVEKIDKIQSVISIFVILS